MEQNERELIEQALATNFELRKLYDQHVKFEGRLDRLGRQAVAVIDEPLNVADPDRDLRQFVGIFIRLDAVQLRWRNGEKETARALLVRKIDDFLLQIQQAAQNHRST